MNDEEIKNEENNENFDDVTFVDSTEDGEEISGKDIVKKLRNDLKKTRSEKEEYLTGWQRAKADYVNLQKEMEQLRSNSSIIAKEKMTRNLLPTLDSFDMAFANKEAWEKVDQNWRTGVEYIYQQFMTGLFDSGIEKIDKAGVPFDPGLHQSIDTISTSDKSKDHTIEKILQTGYKIGDRVVRPARVNIYEYKE
ncbi:MAG: nucleotide exchange factor GrpE [Patescibacteria group bacterium]|nr:nucleotide exchange factor GrpE [Patescibacteria group bacterium]